MTDTREPPGGAPAAAPTTDGGGGLQRADGVQLIGEMDGSGYRIPPKLVRRADGQTIQLTPLLFALLESIDGERDADATAAAVEGRTGRTVSADNVRTLVDEQLRPLGLLTRPDGSQPEVKRSNPLLGLRLRYSITDPVRTRRLTAPFAALFHPLVSIPMLLALAVICWWVFFREGLAGAAYEAFEHPGLLLLVFGVTILSAGFHEFGHAAGATRGGATPGVMGAGVYLVWPAFYTDVTDSYRLGRGGRVVTDLGGLYFNAIVAVAVTGVWWATGYDALLLVVATQILQMLQQLTPLIRFDGYHVLADVTGVPDLFHRIKPTLLGVLPWRWGDPEAKLLKPWARAVITLWVAVVVPMLLLALVAMVLTLPRILGTAWARLQYEVALLESAAGDGDWLQSTARVFTMLAVILPVAAVLYMLFRLGRQVGTATWRRTAGQPVKRGIAVATGLALVAGLAWVWWPRPDTYRPIQADEGGTITDLLQPVAAMAPGVLPPTSTTTAAGAAAGAGTPTTPYAAGDQGSMRTVWDTGQSVPTEAEPQLAVIVQPVEGSPAADDGEQPEGWIFPFDQPLAPEPGDNQALAVTTEDGTVTYDVALAMVWVEGGEDALNTNEAYAFASCDACAAVSVAFQVVFVVGDNDVAAPQNLAAAVNYNCVNCLTYALAQQLFITLDGPLSDEAMGQLDTIWAALGAFGQEITSIPLDEIQDRLDEFEQQILAVIEADQPGTVPSAPPASESPTDGTTPAPEESTSSEPSPTSETEPSESPTPSESSSPTETTTPSESTSPTAETSPTTESSPTD